MSIDNNVQLIGRLTRDLEVGVTPNGGKTYGKTAIAINKDYQDKNGEWVKNTMFVDLIAWGEKPVNYLKNKFKKGALVALQGELEINNYVAKDGTKRLSVAVKVLTSKVMPSNNSNNANQNTNFVPSFEPSNDFGANTNNNSFANLDTSDLDAFVAVDDDDNIPF